MAIQRYVSVQIPYYGDGSSTSVVVDLLAHMESYNDPYSQARTQTNACYPVIPTGVVQFSSSDGLLSSVTLDGQYATLGFSSAPPAVQHGATIYFGFGA